MRTWVPCQKVLAISLNFASQILLMVPFCSISNICHTFSGSWSNNSLTFFLAAGRQPALVLPGDDPDLLGAPYRSRGGRLVMLLGGRLVSRGGRNMMKSACGRLRRNYRHATWTWTQQTCNIQSTSKHAHYISQQWLPRVAAEARRPAWQ